jgi:pimeloyl-ACP methyl ester carboxylesterase
MSGKMTEMVVLVPGVGLGGAEMAPLAWRLRRAGYRTRILWHCPWAGDLDGKARHLRRLTSEHRDLNKVHFVGHSLGGHIVLRMLAHGVPENLGRIVTMGTPHMGSAAARRIGRIPLLRLVLGRALEEACMSAPLPLPRGCELGTIAGRLNFLLGTLLGATRPNDTIVAEREARHPAATEHVGLLVPHGTMLLSSRVASHVRRFLAEGAFVPAERGVTS